MLKDRPEGIDVCLSCFNGGCVDDTRHHAPTHAQRSGHAFVVNVKRKLRPSTNRVRAPLSFLNNRLTSGRAGWR
jgi:uncharacterized UBP type Zn finger protein